IEILKGIEVVRNYKHLLPQEVGEVLDDTVSKLKHRNKLVTLAETSHGGWTTVSEYEKPLLGSDSDDEKRIKQAEARALKKIKTKKTTSVPRSSSPYNINKRLYDFMGRPNNNQGQGSPFPDRFLQSFRSSHGTGTSRDAAICFSCGLRGHFRHECTARDQSRTRGIPATVSRYSPGEPANTPRKDYK
ncbi:uncharacterized protein LOC128557403, partial [Mercenaria mercenaria]|uniref:uncharacterized protein LOC128557403 n=1 Tax=Mercenaria mercenaria TaxID=6596 RepID=UPI00234EBEE2